MHECCHRTEHTFAQWLSLLLQWNSKCMPGHCVSQFNVLILSSKFAKCLTWLFPTNLTDMMYALFPALSQQWKYLLPVLAHLFSSFPSCFYKESWKPHKIAIYNGLSYFIRNVGGDSDSLVHSSTIAITCCWWCALCQIGKLVSFFCSF